VGGEIFHIRTEPFWGIHSLLYSGQSGRGVALITNPPSSAEVKENVEVYLWDIVAGSRVNFTFLKQAKRKRGKRT
jgi:hypothetical protein